MPFNVTSLPSKILWENPMTSLANSCSSSVLHQCDGSNREDASPSEDALHLEERLSLN